jgi:hypothetical protein
VIIKCISRKSNVDQLIKYVLREEKIAPKEKPNTRHWYAPGVKLSKQDIKYLNAELVDGRLLTELKAFKGNMKEFIETRLLHSNDREKRNALESIFKENMRSRSINGYIREFKENENLRLHKRSNNVQAYHTILSFSQKDSGKLTAKILKDITREYISLRGPNSLYLGAVHTDRDHVHIHLIQSGVQYQTGLANRISRQQFQQLKQSMQDYQIQKYPFLKHSLPQHVKAGLNKTALQPRKNIKPNERESEKQTLIALIRTTFKGIASKEEFLDRLAEQGHVPYFRDGKLQGVRFEGDTKYRFSTLGFKEEIKNLNTAEFKVEAAKIEKYEQDKMDEYKAIAEPAKLIEKNMQASLGKEVAVELEQETKLKELQQLRIGKNRTRNRVQKITPEKKPTCEEKMKGKSENEIRAIQQEMSNMAREVEREHGAVDMEALPKRSDAGSEANDESWNALTSDTFDEDRSSADGDNLDSPKDNDRGNDADDCDDDKNDEIERDDDDYDMDR